MKLFINESSNNFNKQKFFDIVEEVLRTNNIPIDDFKGNISVMDIGIYDAYVVKCIFSWIFYTEDIPKQFFNSKAHKIEDIIRNNFKLDDYYDVRCTRYNDSQYASDGYDVELELRISMANAIASYKQNVLTTPKEKKFELDVEPEFYYNYYKFTEIYVISNTTGEILEMKKIDNAHDFRVYLDEVLEYYEVTSISPSKYHKNMFDVYVNTSSHE